MDDMEKAVIGSTRRKEEAMSDSMTEALDKNTEELKTLSSKVGTLVANFNDLKVRTEADLKIVNSKIENTDNNIKNNHNIMVAVLAVGFGFVSLVAIFAN